MTAPLRVLTEYVRQGGFTFVVIDTLAKSFAGEENDTGDMGSYVTVLDRLREATPGTDGSRGASLEERGSPQVPG